MTDAEKPVAAEPTTFMDLEAPICDLVRATRISYKMAVLEALNESAEDQGLALSAIEQAQRLALDLRTAFYKCVEDTN